MKKNWSSGKTAAVVLGSICAGMILLTVFCVDVFRLARVFFVVENESHVANREETDEEPESSRDKFKEELTPREDSGSSSRDKDYDDSYDDFFGYDSYDDESEYYEFHDEIREDLFYQVEFEYYSEEFDNKNVAVSVIYPVVYGKDSAIDFSGVNNAIQNELGEIKDYTASVAEEFPEDVEFSFEADSYVTYMDEKILSIIYVEDSYIDEESFESYVVSVNVDMESGLAMTNSQILDIDDNFSIDFRNRSEEQNGEIGGLSLYSDQDITGMLTDDESLIIFYTPLGMEVGFNYYYGWVTVTYKDYQKYKSHF